jgi:hypothetical protein
LGSAGAHFFSKDCTALRPQDQKLGPQVKNGGHMAAILVLNLDKSHKKDWAIKFGADDGFFLQYKFPTVQPEMCVPEHVLIMCSYLAIGLCNQGSQILVCQNMFSSCALTLQ